MIVDYLFFWSFSNTFSEETLVFLYDRHQRSCDRFRNTINHIESLYFPRHLPRYLCRVISKIVIHQSRWPGRHISLQCSGGRTGVSIPVSSIFRIRTTRHTNLQRIGGEWASLLPGSLVHHIVIDVVSSIVYALGRLFVQAVPSSSHSEHRHRSINPQCRLGQQKAFWVEMHSLSAPRALAIVPIDLSHWEAAHKIWRKQ